MSPLSNGPAEITAVVGQGGYATTLQAAAGLLDVGPSRQCVVVRGRVDSRAVVSQDRLVLSKGI